MDVAPVCVCYDLATTPTNKPVLCTLAFVNDIWTCVQPCIVTYVKMRTQCFFIKFKQFALIYFTHFLPPKNKKKHLFWHRASSLVTLWLCACYTELKIDLDNPCKYIHKRLRQPSAIKKPQPLIIEKTRQKWAPWSRSPPSPSGPPLGSSEATRYWQSPPYGRYSFSLAANEPRATA